MKNSIIYNPIFAFSISIVIFYLLPLVLYNDGVYLESTRVSIYQILSIIFFFWFCFALPFLVHALVARTGGGSRISYFPVSRIFRYIFPLICIFTSLVTVREVSQASFYLCMVYGIYFSLLVLRRNLKIYEAVMFLIIIILAIFSGDKSFILMLVLPSFMTLVIKGRLVRGVLAGLSFVGVIFYTSAVIRGHHLMESGRAVIDLVFALIIGRLNMIEPFTRLLVNPDRFDAISGLYVGNNTLFPNVLSGLIPRSVIDRVDVSPAQSVSRVYYSGDTNVTLSAFAETYGNFGFGGGAYYLFFGGVSYFLYSKFLKSHSRLMYYFYTFYILYALYLHVERYQALMFATLLKALVVILFAVMMQRVVLRV